MRDLLLRVPRAARRPIGILAPVALAMAILIGCHLDGIDSPGWVGGVAGFVAGFGGSKLGRRWAQMEANTDV